MFNSYVSLPEGIRHITNIYPEKLGWLPPRFNPPTNQQPTGVDRSHCEETCPLSDVRKIRWPLATAFGPQVFSQVSSEEETPRIQRKVRIYTSHTKDSALTWNYMKL